MFPFEILPKQMCQKPLLALTGRALLSHIVGHDETATFSLVALPLQHWQRDPLGFQLDFLEKLPADGWFSIPLSGRNCPGKHWLCPFGTLKITCVLFLCVLREVYRYWYSMMFHCTQMPLTHKQQALNVLSELNYSYNSII